MAGVALQGIAKSYGHVPAVRDLTLWIEDGELLVLVGPSGCGKTTTLRLVAGLEELDAGEIEIGGKPVSELPPAERDVAMVFQSYALFPHMTVFENLAFGLAARRSSGEEIRAAVGAVAESLGLAGLLERKPRQLSGGERQRVALGRAIVRNPAVFLMDEPLSNLDAQLRVHTRAEIVRLQSRLRTTMIYVTHDQTEALSMGHRIGVLRDGELQQLGTPREVYGSPANLFVASFIGSPAMNQIRVSLQDGALAWPDGRAALPARFRDLVQRHLILGIRPEHVHVSGSRWSAGAEPAEPFGAAVDVVESAGDLTYLALMAGDMEIVARVEPSFTPSRGETLRVWFDPRHIHLFDAATGEAIR